MAVMNGEQRASVKAELADIETNPKRRNERNTMWVYYLELCLKTNELPA